jgi:hypothetical protein
MKKLLVLVLVLAMASLASATVSMTLSGDSTPGSGTISMYVVPSPTGQIDLQMAIGLIGSGTLDLGTMGVSAPTDSADTDASLAMMGVDGTYGNGEIWTMTSFTSVYPTGVWLTVNYTGAVAGDTITAFQSADGNFDDVDMQSNTIVIPEPATIALLCLGGLLLRKKK